MRANLAPVHSSSEKKRARVLGRYASQTFIEKLDGSEIQVPRSSAGLKPGFKFAVCCLVVLVFGRCCWCLVGVVGACWVYFVWPVSVACAAAFF